MFLLWIWHIPPVLGSWVRERQENEAKTKGCVFYGMERVESEWRINRWHLFVYEEGIFEGQKAWDMQGIFFCFSLREWILPLLGFQKSLSNLKEREEGMASRKRAVFCMDLWMLSQREFALRWMAIYNWGTFAQFGYPKPGQERNKRIKVRADDG